MPRNKARRRVTPRRRNRSPFRPTWRDMSRPDCNRPGGFGRHRVHRRGPRRDPLLTAVPVVSAAPHDSVFTCQRAAPRRHPAVTKLYPNILAPPGQAFFDISAVFAAGPPSKTRSPFGTDAPDLHPSAGRTHAAHLAPLTPPAAFPGTATPYNAWKAHAPGPAGVVCCILLGRPNRSSRDGCFSPGHAVPAKQHHRFRPSARAGGSNFVVFRGGIPHAFQQENGPRIRRRVCRRLARRFVRRRRARREGRQQ